MRSDNRGVKAGCGCWIGLFIAELILGGWSVNWLLLEFFYKTIPFFWATVIGIVVGSVSIPVTIVLSILKSFGIF